MSQSKTVQQILTALEAGHYAPVYFLQGDESYFIDQITDFIIAHALPAHEKPFNLRVRYGKEHNLNEILGHAHSLPMLGSRQVVVVKEAQEMGDLNRAEGQKMLLRYLNAPNLQTVLVFAFKQKTLQNKALLKGFETNNHLLFSTPKVYEKKLGSWITHFVSKQGRTISPKASTMLQGLLGTKLQLFANELQKLLLNTQQGAMITEEQVKKSVSIQRELNGFALQNAIAKKQIKATLEIVNYLSQNEKKYPLIPIVSLLTTFFLKVLQLHYLPTASPHAQAEALKIPTYFIKDYQYAAQKHSLPMVISHLYKLHKADLQLKGIDTATMKSADILKELAAGLISDYPSP